MKYLLPVFGLLCLSLADESKDLKEFTTGYDAFSSDIYKGIVKNNLGNFIVCPLSLDIILALVRAGARGQTAAELTAALRIPENPEHVFEIFNALKPHLQGNDKYNLSSANKIYIKEGLQINKQFENAAVNVFNAEVQCIDFVKRKKAASEINQWVESKTFDKIKYLVQPDVLNEGTRSVLINAIYFYGNWVRRFDENNTTKRWFHSNNKNNIMTDMMCSSGLYDYYETSEVKILRLQYAGEDVSIHIVLPNSADGLAAIEKKIEQILVPPEYVIAEVDVMLPKFKLESQIDFVPILQEMGVKNAFLGSADFRGILTGEENLQVSDVIQKVFIEVEEKGTTAAAASGVQMGSRHQIYEEKTFYADHPFLFYLRLNKPGINFFIGRYVTP